MSDNNVRSLRERFLARTEQVRVRVPIDPDAAADLDAARTERALRAAKYAAAKDDHEKNRKLSEKPPVEPDYTDVDKWISDAEQKVDENSIMVVLQWRPKRYIELARQSQDERWTEIQLSHAMAEAYYVRTEALEQDEWTDLGLSWDQIAERCTDGELHAIGMQARGLATTSDAAPFVPRGKTSAKG